MWAEICKLSAFGLTSPLAFLLFFFFLPNYKNMLFEFILLGNVSLLIFLLLLLLQCLGLILVCSQAVGVALLVLRPTIAASLGTSQDRTGQHRDQTFSLAHVR